MITPTATFQYFFLQNNAFTPSYTAALCIRITLFFSITALDLAFLVSTSHPFLDLLSWYYLCYFFFIVTKHCLKALYNVFQVVRLSKQYRLYSR